MYTWTLQSNYKSMSYPLIFLSTKALPIFNAQMILVLALTFRELSIVFLGRLCSHCL